MSVFDAGRDALRDEIDAAPDHPPRPVRFDRQEAVMCDVVVFYEPDATISDRATRWVAAEATADLEAMR